MYRIGPIVAHTGNLLFAGSASAAAPGKSGYAPVNGLKLYYEVHGSGEPLILLHGGLGAGDMFAPMMPVLSQHRQVITVDLQAHGRTADIDRPITFEVMADDIAGLAKYLGITNGRRYGLLPWRRRRFAYGCSAS